MADEIAPTTLCVIEFDHRSDGGDLLVGPFAAPEDADAYAEGLNVEGWDASYTIVSLAAVTEAAEALEGEEMPPDELEEGEELITEIPVHGVATMEGIPTGDGRGFRRDSLFFDYLPQPLGYEYVSTHGGSTSEVAIVGRIDRFEVVDIGNGQAEARWWGVVMPHKPHAAEAIDGIIDGSYTGVSVIVDSVTEDVTEERQRLLARLSAQNEAEGKEIHEMTPKELEEFVDEIVGDGTQPTRWFSKAQIRRFDMVPTGAFAQGFIALGHEFADELTPDAIEASIQALADCGCMDGLEVEVSADGNPVKNARAAAEAIVAAAIQSMAPGTHDGPGWITNPVGTARIRRYWVRGAGAAKIKWGVPGDFNRCRMQLAKYVQNPDWLAGLCANMHKEALGVWPGQEGGGRGHSLAASGEEATLAPLYALTAAAAPVEHRYFEEPSNILNVGGVVVDGDWTYGYVAEWNVCHIGQPEGPGTCTLAPRSNSNYAHFRTGNVRTDAGVVPVGPITMNTGHAGGYASATAAAAHYDNTGTVIAHVVTGENERGIWFSGRIRPGAKEEDVYNFAASGQISGDWRTIGGNYELVGALVVNVGGFVVPNPALTASAEMGGISLVAAGIAAHEAPSEAEAAVLKLGSIDHDLIAQIARTTIEEFIASQKKAAPLTVQVVEARDQLAKFQLARARRELEQLVR